MIYDPCPDRSSGRWTLKELVLKSACDKLIYRILSMKKSYRHPVVLGLALLVGCSSGGRGPVEEMADVGTHHLHALVAGEGMPVVIIDGGIGAGSEEYRPLQERLAVKTTVITYDRAGYGLSEPGPLPRDSGTEAGELRVMLHKMGVAGPYVLVGHSLGGLNMEVYAHRYPDEVAGLVLLDPPPLAWLLGEGFPELLRLAEQMTDEWQKTADRGFDAEDVRARREAVFFQMLASEHREMLGTSARLASEIITFGTLPLTVIASGVPNPQFGADSGAYQSYWIEQSRVLAAKSSRGKLVLAKNSTHRLHIDAADLVAENILSIVEGAKEKR
jgi:pimeloyl-ACP methyl ester carboxylesterase